jgi:Skp family chaperone for outer membrane proteins
MKRIAVLFGFAAAVVLVVFGLTGTLYSQAAQQTKIGVVNLEKVSDGFDRWQRCDAGINAESVKLARELDKKLKDIEKKQEELKNFEKWSKKYTEILIEAENMKIQRAALYQTGQRKLVELAKKHGDELLIMIEGVIRDYGRANGYTIIIKKDERPAGAPDWNQLIGYVSRNSVLYHNRGIDLTDEIIKLLNKKYK